MINKLISTCAIAGLLFLCACAAPKAPHDQITQVGHLNALMLGHYDGVFKVGDLGQYGDFGLGTFDHLDGELVLLNGEVWQGRGDGSVVRVPSDITTPFSVVTPFQADGTFESAPVTSLKQLEAQLDSKLPEKNLFFAIRLDAQFDSITFRTVPRQDPPYKPLAEVVKAQQVWTRPGISGTLIGIRSPLWVGNLTVPGYHWHFLSLDKKFGGHIFDLKLSSAQVSYDRCHSWLIQPNEAIAGNADLTEDTSKDLDKVEKQRGN